MPLTLTSWYAEGKKTVTKINSSKTESTDESDSAASRRASFDRNNDYEITPTLR